MDYLTSLRLQKLFNPLTQMDPTVMGGGSFTSPDNNNFMNISDSSNPPTNSMNSGMNDIGQRMMQMYHPDTTMEDKFNSLANNYPTASEPSRGRKIAGSILGALTDLGRVSGGEGNGQNVFDEITGKNKFKEDVANWENQIKPLEQGANIERQTNSNERQMAYQNAALQLKQEAQDAKDKNDATKAEIAQQRANIYSLKATKPDTKFNFSGPTIIATDSTGKIVDTGVPTGNMTALDKLTLGHDNKLEEIQATNENKVNLEGIHNNNIMGQIGLRGEQSRQTKEDIPGKAPSTGATKEVTPNARQFQTARELYNTRPDLQPFIHLQGTTFTIDPPSAGGLFSKKGPNAQQFKEINDTIYNSKSPNSTPNNQTQNTSVTKSNQSTNQSTNQPLTRQVRNKTTGEVKTQISTDGGKTWSFQ